jgi:aldehyde dehydrogenase (NAD+)
LAGGQACEGAGYYYPPTILDCSDVADAVSLTTELFGPVLSVDSFSSEQEAIQNPTVRLMVWQLVCLPTI